MADKQDKVTDKASGNQVVTLVDARKPILVKDQYGNPYICLNWYEAQRIRNLIEQLRDDGLTRYDTGDWWLDVPYKIHEWQYQANDMLATDPDTKKGLL